MKHTRRRLLVLYLLAELLHEIESEAERRPDWIDTAIDGVNAILDRMAPGHDEPPFAGKRWASRSP